MATEQDTVNTAAAGTLVVVSALAVAGLVAAITALARNEQRALQLERESLANLRSVRELNIEQQAALNAAPAWTDKASGKMSIPIQAAMQLVTQRLAADPNSASPPPVPAMGSGGAAARPEPTEPPAAAAADTDAGGADAP